MDLRPFLLEQYFAKHEFSARYLYSSSDCEGLASRSLLSRLEPDEKRLWDKLTLGYTESGGSALLREAILPFYPGLTIKDIVVSSPGELAACFFDVCLRAGDHVVAMAPAYQSLLEVPRSIGCELSLWMPDPASWTFRPEDLEALLKPNTKMVILNFPHNPTGAYPTPEAWKSIVGIVAASGAWLYSDEMYRGLWIAQGLIPLPPACLAYDKAVSLWGMSKTFGMAGVRIGWLACPQTAIRKAVQQRLDYLSICCAAPSELISTFALRRATDIMSHNTNRIRRHISLFQTAFADTGLFPSFIPPRAGSVAFVPLNCPFSSLDFSDKLVADTGIMTVPAEMFSYPGKYLRIGFGRTNFPQVTALLARYHKKKQI